MRNTKKSLTCRSFPSGAVVYNIPYYEDDRGALNVLEISKELPFECKRIFYTYTVPRGQVRGEHSHKRCEQFLIAVNGVVSVLVDDGVGHKDEIMLDSPSKGLWLPCGRWGEQYGHSTDCILLVLASMEYDNNDYIRTYEDFLKFKKESAV
jgi:dTDP-4-dehydrorhamnose 3,5-epimerase-like enzyme